MGGSCVDMIFGWVGVGAHNCKMIIFVGGRGWTWVDMSVQSFRMIILVGGHGWTWVDMGVQILCW